MVANGRLSKSLWWIRSGLSRRAIEDREPVRPALLITEIRPGETEKEHHDDCHDKADGPCLPRVHASHFRKMHQDAEHSSYQTSGLTIAG